MHTGDHVHMYSYTLFIEFAAVSESESKTGTSTKLDGDFAPASPLILGNANPHHLSGISVVFIFLVISS